MMSILLLVATLVFSYGKQPSFQQLPDGGIAPYVSFSNNINDAVDLMLSTQAGSKKPRNEFWLLVDNNVIKSVLVTKGSINYQMDSEFAFSPQTASVVIHIPKHASAGITQADFPADKQIRLRNFLLNQLRLNGYKSCEHQATSSSTGNTLKLHCSAYTGSKA